MVTPLQLSGQTISHYRIIEKLGGGGMGVVYRATDMKLGRDVALKVLPQDMASDAERLARFQREARAVAALNHPNVVTLHSVEEYDGVHFLTMELVEGQTLDHLISATGLPLERIVEIASALAEALAAAHEKGILHRDLKPANVMVTNEGRVKVLDFGLAKDVRGESANDPTLTSAGQTLAGVVMGTPAYMSPEQVSGRALDHRTDIFSLGVVLHEMATGRRPFEGRSSPELMSAILRDTPPYVSEVRADLPGSGRGHPALPGEGSPPTSADRSRSQHGVARPATIGPYDAIHRLLTGIASRRQARLGRRARRGGILGGRAALQIQWQ